MPRVRLERQTVAIDWSAIKDAAGTALLNALATNSTPIYRFRRGDTEIEYMGIDKIQALIAECDRQLAAGQGGLTSYASFKRPGVGL